MLYKPSALNGKKYRKKIEFPVVLAMVIYLVFSKYIRLSSFGSSYVLHVDPLLNTDENHRYFCDKSMI